MLLVETSFSLSLFVEGIFSVAFRNELLLVTLDSEKPQVPSSSMRWVEKIKRLTLAFRPSSNKLSSKLPDGFLALIPSTSITSFSEMLLALDFFCFETKRKNNAAPTIDAPTAAPAITAKLATFPPSLEVVVPPSLVGSSTNSKSSPVSSSGVSGCDDFNTLSVLFGSTVESINCNVPRSIAS